MTTITSPQPRAAANAASASQEDEELLFLGVRVSSWVMIGILAITFCLLFWPNLRRLWTKTNPIYGEDNWKHGAFVPIIGLYYLYVNRDQILRAKVKTAWSGLLITIAGVLIFAYGIYPGQNDWFKDVGMVVTLFGLVALIGGWQIMKIAWFPIAFLICALPWPGLFYSMLAGPLQKLAAMVAVRMLNFFGVSSLQSGTKIFIEGSGHVIRTLNVAEACAGLRSLMSFIAIAGAVAFLSFRPLWQKIVMVFSAIPIAIFCNTMRITVQGLFDGYLSHQWSESFAHGFLGLAMMIPAFFLILLVGWVLQNLLIEEGERNTIRAASHAQTRAARVQAIPRQMEPRLNYISRVPSQSTQSKPANGVGRAEAVKAATLPQTRLPGQPVPRPSIVAPTSGSAGKNPAAGKPAAPAVAKPLGPGAPAAKGNGARAAMALSPTPEADKTSAANKTSSAPIQNSRQENQP